MTCACGYVTECAIWCGSGHQTGQCPWYDYTLEVPPCPTCGDFRIESHPRLEVVRCANCKEHLLW